MINKVTIYGERCSGTNYLEELLTENFDVTLVWKYGWKHFFGFNDLKNSDDVLFIGIVRNLHDWVNSLYKGKHHLPKENTDDVNSFLNNEWYSVDKDNKEMLNDRHIETKNRYKNIFELRHVKNKFLVEEMPKLVKNYLLITYDELVSNFVKTMRNIKNYKLPVKVNIKFPANISYYKKRKDKLFVKTDNNIDGKIDKKTIMEKANLHYEKILFKNENFENK
jgi:hypothetical protein